MVLPTPMQAHVRGFAYRNYINEDGESRKQTHYYQIGNLREMTDDKGNLRGSNFYNYSPNVQPWVNLYRLSSGCNDGDEKDSKLINQKKKN